MIWEALNTRQASDVWVIRCPDCNKLCYYNEGLHAGCPFCNRDLTCLIDDEACTLQDVWDYDFYMEEIGYKNVNSYNEK